MGVQTGSAKPYTSGLGVERGLRNIICFFVILAHNLKLLFQLCDFTFYFLRGIMNLPLVFANLLLYLPLTMDKIGLINSKG